MKKTMISVLGSLVVLSGCGTSTGTEPQSVDPAEEVIRVIDSSVDQSILNVDALNSKGTDFNAWEEGEKNYTLLTFNETEPPHYGWSILKDGVLLQGEAIEENGSFVIEDDKISKNEDPANQKAIFVYSIFGEAFEENEDHKMELNSVYKVEKEDDTYTISYSRGEIKDDGKPKEVLIQVESDGDKISKIESEFTFNDDTKREETNVFSYDSVVSDDIKDVLSKQND